MHDLVSDPGGALIAHHNAIRTAAFRRIQAVGFFPYCGIILMIHNYTCFGAQYAQRKCPWGADPAFLIHLASDSRYRADPQVSLLPCRLSFRQVGLGTFRPCLDRNTTRAIFPLKRRRSTFIDVSPHAATTCRLLPLQFPIHVSVSPHFHPGRSDFPSPVGDHSISSNCLP